jgi:hypothetical protein
MADQSIVHVGENSPEQVAFKLMEIIASNEGKTLRSATMGTGASADRAWILDAYAACLKVVRNPNAPR